MIWRVFLNTLLFLCQECEFFVEKIDKENKVKTRSKRRGLLGLFG